MSQLDRIVSVSVTRETTSVSQTAFGIPGVMAEFATNKTTTAFTRAREYADMDEVAADGWTSADAVYLALQQIFKQDPCPSSVVVGRKDSTDTDWATALAAIDAENSDWYFFCIIPVTSATPDAEYENAAAWSETQKKQMFLQTTETDVLSSVVTTDIASVLKGLNYDRTTMIYHLAANSTEQAHMAWVGEGAPYDPGSSTWKFRTPSGVTADVLTSAKKSAAWAKHCNTFSTVGGVDITENGITASGEFIDTILGIDWIESKLQETVYGALVSRRKIPFDDSGIQLVRGLVKGVLDEAGRMGILQADTIVVTVPKYADISQANRLARNLPDVKFTATLQGAIHTVVIKGTVSV